MHIKLTAGEMAKAIAEAIADATGEHCEASSDASGSVITLDDTIIARITPLFDAMDVMPLDGPSHLKIPSDAKTVDDLREIALQIDKAISHVLAAAVAAAKH